MNELGLDQEPSRKTIYLRPKILEAVPNAFSGTTSLFGDYSGNNSVLSTKGFGSMYRVGNFLQISKKRI